ncbi:hypothetical protein G7077_02480 [Sphingomonas piscis]|uniref:Uncharacterized protein n=1 Tax=Sphingomonas piscis TaxID=2714943 RepID=A0A6G7YMI8_9SPHN|nr:hypothetical protein [Sphingomonas piscis]QIK77947.1 hypothetical protein G7077_02480 [Sphingomonas piscis]
MPNRRTILTPATPRRRPMSPIVPLIIVLLLVLAGLYFLSTQAKEVEPKTIEVEVSQGANAR